MNTDIITTEELTEQAKAAVKAFIEEKNNHDECLDVLFHMLIGKYALWEDEINDMKFTMQGLLVLLTDAKVAKKFKKLFPGNDRVGIHLYRLCDFFNDLKDETCQAEIQYYELNQYVKKDSNRLRFIITYYKEKIAKAKIEKSLAKLEKSNPK
jgi:hypothetical protein